MPVPFESTSADALRPLVLDASGGAAHRFGVYRFRNDQRFLGRPEGA
ncbi:MAG: hypothetical protein H6518_12325 [Microthrixaceae bacterium]|nr:hypothetical protein [Microthrixaceae bacterium]